MNCSFDFVEYLVAITEDGYEVMSYTSDGRSIVWAVCPDERSAESIRTALDEDVWRDYNVEQYLSGVPARLNVFDVWNRIWVRLAYGMATASWTITDHYLKYSKKERS